MKHSINSHSHFVRSSSSCLFSETGACRKISPSTDSELYITAILPSHLFPLPWYYHAICLILVTTAVKYSYRGITVVPNTEQFSNVYSSRAMGHSPAKLLVCMDDNGNFVRQICLCKLYSVVECSCELDVGYEGRERQLAWLWFCEL